ncbi:relaxin receptor 2-like isoform X2 [Acanthaster planci]|uniref:Relaxin receptor 2-like isoform X2 n=1 Tax=Acanthaster planci TaxID=133434 RepID=A0A8B7XRN4_ACAPL|nr:relaxin receptor 2-like isoform X2 [Acanthaster planci]
MVFWTVDWGMMVCLMLTVTSARTPGVGVTECNGNVTMETGYLCVEDGRWIRLERVCDGLPDCGRLADDEAFCLDSPQPPMCRDLSGNSPVYNCINTTDICLPHRYFCDDYTDCGMAEDELYCDQQYIPGCSFGVLQVTCTNVTLSTSFEKSVPKNIRFVSLNGVPAVMGKEEMIATGLVNWTHYPFLIKLYLVNNNLTRLHLGQPNSLQYLRFLHVSNNKIRTVESTSLLAAPNLVHLELPSNEIVYIDPLAFQGLTSLTELNIMGNKIKTLSTDHFRALNSLEIINMSHNDITDLEPGVFQNAVNVSYMSLSFNSMKTLKKGTFLGLSRVSTLDIENVPIWYIEQGALEGLTGLRSLQLSFNALEFVYPETFRDLTSLQHLAIRGNSLSTVQKGSFIGLHSVTDLDLGNNTFTELRAGTFAGLSKLQVLWMSHVPLRHIEPGAFSGLSNLVSLNILHADLDAPNLGILDGLDNLESLSTSDHRLCCLLNPAQNISCVGPIESFSTCQRLMPNTILRVAIWLLGISAILGNLFVIGQRGVKKGWHELTVQSILITQLAISDTLMGVYMIAIGAADVHFGESYFLSAEAWRTGAWCKAIGFLSILSSEASVFFVMLISVDRFISIAFPFSRFRLEVRFARITVAVLWLIAFVLSLTGTLMAGKEPAFYGLSDVCVGLPLITTPVNQSTTWTYIRETGTYVYIASAAGTQPAWAFSVFLYLGLNFVCFAVVLICYVLIFIVVKRSSQSVARQGKMAGKPSNSAHGSFSHRSVTFSREVKLASRMALVVGTDFLCWMPIIVMGILTQSGLLSVPEELYAWTVVFILPINSSLNPYLYTISKLCSNRRKSSKKKAQCVRMTYTLPRLTNDRILNSAVDSDTVAGFIGRDS